MSEIRTEDEAGSDDEPGLLVIAPGVVAGDTEEYAPEEFARRIAMLEGAPVLCTLSDRLLRLLARRMQRVTVASGAPLLEIGESNDRIYFVEEGLCESTVAGGGPTASVQKLSRGDWFGFTSAMLEALQTSAITALQPTVLYTLSAATLRTELSDVPGAIGSLERLAQQLLENHRQAQLRATATLLPRHEAVVVPIYSASGGSGRTTIALNLSAALASEHPGRVLLMDLALPYTHACLIANLIPTGSLATAAGADGPALERALMSAAQYHPNGMLVLPGARRADEAELVTPLAFDRAFRALKDKFAYIVVDMALALDELAVSIFDKAQQVVLVLTPDLASLRGATEALRILEEAMGIPPQLVTLVVNNRGARAGASRDAIATALERAPEIEIKHDENRPDAASLRGMLAFEDRRSWFRPAMTELAARVKSQCMTPELILGTSDRVREAN